MASRPKGRGISASPVSKKRTAPVASQTAVAHEGLVVPGEPLARVAEHLEGAHPRRVHALAAQVAHDHLDRDEAEPAGEAAPGLGDASARHGPAAG
jgi:hypothetical protein